MYKKKIYIYIKENQYGRVSEKREIKKLLYPSKLDKLDLNRLAHPTLTEKKVKKKSDA